MFRNSRSRFRSVGVSTIVGAAALAVFAVAPASAATISSIDCASQAGTVVARAIRLASGQTIVLQQQIDYSYQGTGQVEVYCSAANGTNLGDVTDAQVKISISPSDPSINASMFTVSGDGVPTANFNPATPGNPVLMGPMSGPTNFTITAPANLLPAGVAAADVGAHFEVVSLAYGQPLTDPKTGITLKPGTFGDVIAQTPELDSLALFGSGALGIVGYALLRRRARQGK